MAGIWEGLKGSDQHPVAEGTGADAYIEHYELEPIDRQTNGPQLFYGLRYHTHIVKPGEVEMFHDQVGYWLWEPATEAVTFTLGIPRGQVLLAGRPGSSGYDRVPSWRPLSDPRSTASVRTPSSTRRSGPSATASTSPSTTMAPGHMRRRESCRSQVARSWRTTSTTTSLEPGRSTDTESTTPGEHRRRHARDRRSSTHGRQFPVNHLTRELAPVTDAAWAQIDAEATRSLTHFLAARRIVDFRGPLGWEHSAVDLGARRERR